MWARNTELMLGLWMAASPFVLRHDPGSPSLWAHDLGCALLVVTLSLCAHWPRLSRCHLLLLPLAGWLMAAGWWASRGLGPQPPPAFQNWILVGLTLAMLAIVPSRASAPPQSWQRIRADRRSASERPT